MKAPTDMGKNRTGAKTNPILTKELVEGAAAGVREGTVSAAPLLAIREELAREAEPVGTTPPPATIKGAAKAIAQAFKGVKATVLLDCIGERLAFERTGTRLYELLIAKVAGADPRPGNPTKIELARIRDEELEHFQLLTSVMEELGGDPTAMTPSADVIAVASCGLLQVLADPRTTLNEGLKAILVAELADNDSWRTLVELASRLELDEIAARFQQALEQEEEHLLLVRSWVNAGTLGDAGLDPTAAPGREVPASP
jgi:rubrerythrin